MNTLSHAPCTCTALNSDRHLQSAVVAVLDQVIDLLERMTQEQFVQSPVGVVHSGVGPHVRHCLDHFDALLTAMVTGRLDFDHRERGTPVERRRDAALDEARRLRAGLLAVDPASLDRGLELRAQASEDGPVLTMSTTARRELHYLLNHTIHHNALIGVLARSLGVSPPERFGYAPSTLAYLKQKPCAR